MHGTVQSLPVNAIYYKTIFDCVFTDLCICYIKPWQKNPKHEFCFSETLKMYALSFKGRWVNGLASSKFNHSIADEEILSGSLNVTIHKLQGLDYPCGKISLNQYFLFHVKLKFFENYVIDSVIVILHIQNMGGGDPYSFKGQA